MVLPTSTVESDLRLPGQLHDKETDLQYNFHRYYDPLTGRYLKTDPIGIEVGPNLYSYTLNNPINMLDPHGLTTIPIPIPMPNIPGPNPLAAAGLAGFTFGTWLTQQSDWLGGGFGETLYDQLNPPNHEARRNRKRDYPPAGAYPETNPGKPGRVDA